MRKTTQSERRNNLLLVLLLIRNIMLNGSSNSLRLHTLDISTRNSPVQMWVLGEEFKATATYRRTLDVDSWSKDDVAVFDASFNSEGFAYFAS